MTNEHTSLEKQTSHTLCERVAKGLSVRGEMETEQTATYWPPIPLSLAAILFSFCWAAQPGVLRAQTLCWELVLTASNCNSNFNCNWPQLTRTVCGTRLYNCLTPTCFPCVSQLHRIQSIHRSRLYLDVFDRMHPFLDWRLGRRSICYISMNFHHFLKTFQQQTNRVKSAQSVGGIEYTDCISAAPTRRVPWICH